MALFYAKSPSSRTTDRSSICRWDSCPQTVWVKQQWNPAALIPGGPLGAAPRSGPSRVRRLSSGLVGLTWHWVLIMSWTTSSQMAPRIYLFLWILFRKCHVCGFYTSLMNEQCNFPNGGTRADLGRISWSHCGCYSVSTAAYAALFNTDAWW